MIPLCTAPAIRGMGTRVLAAAGVIACMAIGGFGSARAATLQVMVTGVRNGDGTVNVCVFDTDQGFPDCSHRTDLRSRRQPATRGAMRFDFDVDPGLHAVSVLHDENGNGRLDTNFLGIPQEGVGASNNPASRLGPPRFADAAFRLPPQGGAITVQLVYP